MPGGICLVELAKDMFRLPYAQKSFEVVIASNALHIVPHPEKAMQEIRRVLKDDGVLIAPTFTHAENSVSGKAEDTNSDSTVVAFETVGGAEELPTTV